MITGSPTIEHDLCFKGNATGTGVERLERQERERWRNGNGLERERCWNGNGGERWLGWNGGNGGTAGTGTVAERERAGTGAVMERERWGTVAWLERWEPEQLLGWNGAERRRCSICSSSICSLFQR